MSWTSYWFPFSHFSLFSLSSHSHTHTYLASEPFSAFPLQFSSRSFFLTSTLFRFLAFILFCFSSSLPYSPPSVFLLSCLFPSLLPCLPFLLFPLSFTFYLPSYIVSCFHPSRLAFFFSSPLPSFLSCFHPFLPLCFPPSLFICFSAFLPPCFPHSLLLYLPSSLLPYLLIFPYPPSTPPSSLFPSFHTSSHTSLLPCYPAPYLLPYLPASLLPCFPPSIHPPIPPCFLLTLLPYFSASLLPCPIPRPHRTEAGDSKASVLYPRCSETSLLSPYKGFTFQWVCIG